MDWVVEQMALKEGDSWMKEQNIYKVFVLLQAIYVLLVMWIFGTLGYFLVYVWHYYTPAWMTGFIVMVFVFIPFGLSTIALSEIEHMIFENRYYCGFCVNYPNGCDKNPNDCDKCKELKKEYEEAERIKKELKT